MFSSAGRRCFEGTGSMLLPVRDTLAPELEADEADDEDDEALMVKEEKWSLGC